MKSRPPAATCPNCGGDELYVTVRPISAGGGHAPNLLPGLGPWYRSGKLRGVLCADCGLYRQYAEAEARELVRTSTKWQRV